MVDKPTAEKEKIHIRLIDWGKNPETIEVEVGATPETALALVNKPFKADAVRVGGRSVPADLPLQDGQTITYNVPKITVG